SVERTSNVVDLYKLGRGYDMPSEQVDGMNPETVHEALTKAAEHIRAGNGPYFLEIQTYRYKGHSVSDPAKYRTKEEENHYKEIDPIKVLKSKIIETGIATKEEISQIEANVKIEIEDAAKFAEESPYPDPSELYTDNYVENDYPYIKD
ncbi:MAG: pyruvate dehydrogenase (acetyl-transferring) E1 component subunit alpha, partial [Saprospiraceae bacterium]|nr:pyruvate dehydrogenase (acetyl-transferring) E1 component subunit alpha [Saprospiraceae bacterium]